MSTPESACYSTPEEAGLRIETVPFSKIPQQSQLFLDYLKDPLALRKFYPSAVRFHHELPARVPEVLANYKTDRNVLCDALREMNEGWGAGEKTLGNIDLLRDEDSVAVVSGQQAGLFTGPLYTIYKAISAVKLAGCLTQRNTKAVPVFWIATEDHDFPEVASTEIIARDCRLSSVAAQADLRTEGLPVGRIRLEENTSALLDQLFELLPNSEFTEDLQTLLRQSWQEGIGFGDAFARLLTGLIGDYGLVLVDPMDARLKQLAAPLYSQSACRAQEIAEAIEARSKELESAGYHAQVTPSPNSFPLFIHDENGARHAMTRTVDGRYRAKDGDESYTCEELSEMALAQPQKFSPNVTLRAVVQDYLLPTVAYYGGSAEIAYFAQTTEVYRILGRPATPILPRSSLTMIEHHTGRTLERYGLSFVDLFNGPEAVMARVVEEYLGTETAAQFAQAEQTVNRELDELSEKLREVDPTLADALETGRRKINYQLDGLRTRFHRAQLARDEAAQRQIERAFDQLYPQKALQERHVNITSLLARHGRYVIDWIFSAVNLESNDHQLVYL